MRPLIRSIALLALVLAACTGGEGLTATSSTSTTAYVEVTESTVDPTPGAATTVPPTTSIPATTTTLVPDDGLLATERSLTHTTTIHGDIAPKSVVASGTGLFIAQNMMYRHTITVYDRSHQLVKTISDTVVPSEFGLEGYEGEYLGSPVEAAFTSDGAYAYVSNYKMYGGNLDTAAGDDCDQGGWPDSFVYRLDMATLEIDQVIRVGPVPKFLAVTPDDRYVVVSNWCGFDVSIIDVAKGREIERIPVGRHPRGIAVSPGSNTAYVAVMGSTDIAVVDLESFSVWYLEDVGQSPRHLVLSPGGQYLYASLNGEGRLVKIDLTTGETVGSVATGNAPRSMAISDDGSALYVVNYNSSTMSKVRTEDMVELVEFETGTSPIGITYDSATREVWVSNYSGTIQVFTDLTPE
jgi:YVTN family beta-propeller protein